MKASKYSLYIKNLYLNAGKSIMDRIFTVFTPYINHNCLESIVDKTNLSPAEISFSVNDIHHAFFHRLCQILYEKIYYSDTVYCIISPYHHGEVILQMIIPQKHSVFTNSVHPHICKANCLYTSNNLPKYTNYLLLANDLFEKSEKIQQ